MNGMTWVIERLIEKTTWMGLVNILVSANVLHVSNDLTQSLVGAAAAISGVILVIMKENAKR